MLLKFLAYFINLILTNTKTCFLNFIILMKKILLIFSIITIFGFTYSSYDKETSIVITPESKLLIKGKTNINKFNCSYNILNFKKPIPVFFELRDGKMIFKKTKLSLENSCFDCGSKAMNKDFYNLLNSETYPNVVLTLNEVESDISNDNIIQANVDIDIAGVVNSNVLPMYIEMDDIMQISGVLDINICDFNLEPPKKALGLVVVDEIIQISFQLKLQEHY